MTTPGALSRPGSAPFGLRVLARIAVALARLLALLPPRRLRAVLGLLRRGARAASYDHVRTRRDAVLAVSLTCLGLRGCLPRSLAVTLLCRMTGTWPTWCAGVRAKPPFGAHAWVEAEGRMVGEGVPAGYFRQLIVVTPRRPRRR
ncbi:lasso peptide biosynthesis B2 protein [Amycolatopsis anabasis]|uniref:lasso peptide biosynthesis B2 protein n=1 Tax=Amycolatopsis anabasis TaxID=1840409 RepID=UPI00131AA10B|nr:lasso peptide biosynthesis B2 protein [Amycolatopsis anabasis]